MYSFLHSHCSLHSKFSFIPLWANKYYNGVFVPKIARYFLTDTKENSLIAGGLLSFSPYLFTFGFWNIEYILNYEIKFTELDFLSSWNSIVHSKMSAFEMSGKNILLSKVETMWQISSGLLHFCHFERWPKNQHSLH